MISSPSRKAYIGQTRRNVQRRFRQHIWPSTRLTAIHQAIMKYGPENMKVETLLEVPNELLDFYERKMIEVYQTFGKRGYNATSGGDVNPMHFESVRKKVADTHKLPDVKANHKASMKRVMNNPSVRKAISKKMKVNLSSNESKQARSNQMKQVWKSDQSKRCSNIKLANARPDVQEKRSTSVKEALHKTESRKRHLEALARNAKDPSVQEKKRVAMQEFWRRKKAELPPPRAR